MIHLAFKVAERTGSAWSKFIAEQSGSPYSHVEGWLSGPPAAAVCFSSREPSGASFQTLDLTDGQWDILPLPGTQLAEDMARGFCIGANNKPYDGLGLLNFKLPGEIRPVHQPDALFCSETWAMILERCYEKDLGGLRPWQISPGMLYDIVKKDFPVNV